MHVFRRVTALDKAGQWIGTENKKQRRKREFKKQYGGWWGVPIKGRIERGLSKIAGPVKLHIDD
jgi:hypothetical protein